MMRMTNGGFPLLSRSYAGPLQTEYGYSIAWTNDGHGDGQYDIGMVGATLTMGAGLGDMYVIGTDPYGISGCNQAQQPYLHYTPAFTHQEIWPIIKDFRIISSVDSVGRAVNAFTRICSECCNKRPAPEEDGGKLSQDLPPGSGSQNRIDGNVIQATMREGVAGR